MSYAQFEEERDFSLCPADRFAGYDRGDVCQDDDLLDDRNQQLAKELLLEELDAVSVEYFIHENILFCVDPLDQDWFIPIAKRNGFTVSPNNTVQF